MTDNLTQPPLPVDDQQPAAENPTDPERTVLPRLWPGVIVLTLQLVSFGLSITPSIHNQIRFGHMMLGPAVCLLLALIWLLGFSRLPWKQRLGLFLLPILLGVVVGQFTEPASRLLLWIYGVPLSIASIVLGLWLTRHANRSRRWWTVCGILLVVWSWYPLIRVEGFAGDYLPELNWRWHPQADLRVVNRQVSAPTATVSASPDQWLTTPEDWPNFRGTNWRAQAVSLSNSWNWLESAPRERWRIEVGPAWSSFASVGDRLFTQEQIGENESITCLDGGSGEVLWQSTYPSRFHDVVAGSGPRATPTFVDGKLFCLGARAVLTCVDARTGTCLWQRNLVQEIQAELPVWGCSGSPLAMAGMVIVYAGGSGENGLVAYRQENGEPVWQVASRGMNFSSPQPMQLAGVDCVLFSDSSGLRALEPATGKVLWTFRPSEWQGPPVCQPQQVGDDELIVALGDAIGVARLKVDRQGEQWTVSELWSSRMLKPSFNDFVYHEGHCYGFDQNIFGCIDASSGERTWKKGRYGFGQVLLVPAVGRLVIVTETGELVLLATNPHQLEELGRIPAVEGKTWNHPILARNRLIVRNGAEAVCFNLGD